MQGHMRVNAQDTLICIAVVCIVGIANVCIVNVCILIIVFCHRWNVTRAQDGLSPAHRAAFALCARRLVEAGADFSLTVEPNLNALLYANELKNAEMAALLRGYRGYHQKVR